MNRQELISALQKKYPSRVFRTTEEFDGMEDGVWVSGEDSGEKTPLFNYYSQDRIQKSYKRGVKVSLHNWLEKRGWYCEWHDAGTVMMWEL